MGWLDCDPGYEPVRENDDDLYQRMAGRGQACAPVFHNESLAGRLSSSTAQASSTALDTGLPGCLGVEEADQATSADAHLYVASQTDLDDLQAELAARPDSAPAVDLPSGGEPAAYVDQPSDRERQLHRQAGVDERRARAILYPRSGRVEVWAA